MIGVFKPGDMVECVQDGNTTPSMVGWIGLIMDGPAIYQALDYFDQPMELYGYSVRWPGVEGLCISKPSQLRLIPLPPAEPADWENSVWKPSELVS